MNANNTLTVRYAWTRAAIFRTPGIGSFDLISRGYHFEKNTNQTVQVTTETAILGAAVNETRLQYFRSANQTSANSNASEISVSGSFNGGGAQTGLASDIQNNFELQNYSIVNHGGVHVGDFREYGYAGRLKTTFRRRTSAVPSRSRVVSRRSSMGITRRSSGPTDCL